MSESEQSHAEQIRGELADVWGIPVEDVHGNVRELLLSIDSEQYPVYWGMISPSVLDHVFV